ncbi:MAG TPA: MurR/RpiR family transcriptional regulator [Bacillota bacterium]|jgi:DNA-binding MurR/RpiR family transcriptional regulator
MGRPSKKPHKPGSVPPAASPAASPARSELEARIRTAYPRLSPAKQKIAQWILRNTEEAAFFSAVMIAKAVGISESVVTRFALDLGFSGFRGLQEASQLILRDRLKVTDRLRRALADEHSAMSHSVRIFERDMENIRETMAGVSEADLEKAADLIVKADKVGVVGLRSALAPGLVLHTFLNEVLGNARLIIPGLGDFFDYLRFWGPKDVVIGASFLMSRNFTLDVMRFAKERKCRVIVITDSAVAPVTEVADLIFVVRTSGEFISYAASMALIDALLYQVAARVKDKSVALASETEGLVRTYFGSRDEERNR